MGNDQLFRELLETMTHTDVPTARPKFDRQTEATGLTLLSLALRLNHVVRVTENLRLINTDHVSRTVSVDVDLRNLTALQRQALTVREAASTLAPSLADTEKVGPRGFGTGRPRLWVPVSRHSREDLAPVVVKNAEGTVVPRLTQQAATRAVIAGVTRLFRTHLNSQRPLIGASFERESHARARWLIESAIATLIDQGMHGDLPTESPASADELSIRTIARNYLLNMDAGQSSHYAELLRAACREYILIVMVPADESHHFLTYETPLIPAVRSSTARRRAWRALLPFSTEFTVDYVTQIPRSVASYHVTIDVPEEIDVRRFILSSDADDVVVEDLGNRIHALTTPVDGARFDEALAAAERREVEAMLRVLGRRRHLDVHGFDYYLKNRDLLHRRLRGNLRSDKESQAPQVSDLRTVKDLPLNEADIGSHSSNTPPPLTLAQIGKWITSHKLGLDVSTDNDPRENGAHAQWRPVALGFGHPSLEPVEARIFLALADEPPALVESVARMVGALVVVVLGVLIAGIAGTYSSGGDAAAEAGKCPSLSDCLTIPQADAAVAVLLIVPGILLTRLDIQSTHSVLGRLRRFPQMVAYLSVVITTGLALIVAGANEDSALLFWAFCIAAALLIVLLVLCFFEQLARKLRRSVLVPSSATIPVWLRQEFHTGRKGRADRESARPDVYFDAIRPVPYTTKVATQDYEDLAAKRVSGELARSAGTPEGPALLADLAARAVASDYTMSEIQIAHARSSRPHDVVRDADEVLFSAWNGHSIQVTTRRIREHDLRSFGGMALESHSSASTTRGAEARWVERARLLPISIRGNTSEIDFVADFAHIRPRHVRQAEMLAFLHHCLEQSSRRSIVPTLVNAPTSPANRHSPNQLQEATGKAIRLTFAVPYGAHSNRLALESAILRHAHERGVGLWRASQRPDAGQGDWELLVAPTPTEHAEEPGTESAGSSLAEYGLVPVTFVGTRNDEGVSAFLGLSGVLLRGGLRMHALTATGIGQYAVVSLLAETPSRNSSQLAAGPPLDLQPALERLRQHGVLARRSWDTEVFKNLPFTVCFGLGGSTASEGLPPAGEARSLWLDWALPNGVIGEDDLATIFRTECQKIGPFEIRYWRTRSGSDERVRGRAKFAIQPGTIEHLAPLGFNIGDTAKAVQSELLRHLQDLMPGAPPHAAFLHVVWSEPWLAPRRGF
jgi:hypothetical protein